MDSIEIFLDKIGVYSQEYHENRAVVSKKAAARSVAAIFLNVDPNAKAPAILRTPGLADYLAEQGITAQRLSEALTAERRDRRANAARAQAEHAQSGLEGRIGTLRKKRDTAAVPVVSPEVVQARAADGAPRIIHDMPMSAI